ncbi:BA14K family protein, partial [Methyloceanibacter marginalis]
VYTNAGYGPPAWTPDWYTYCYSRYRSFNPNTGTFVGYDGYEHFCR